MWGVSLIYGEPVFSFGPESAWVRIDLFWLYESGRLKISKKITLFYTASNFQVSINVSVYSLVCFIIYDVYFESVIGHKKTTVWRKGKKKYKFFLLVVSRPRSRAWSGGGWGWLQGRIRNTVYESILFFQDIGPKIIRLPCSKMPHVLIFLAKNIYFNFKLEEHLKILETGDIIITRKSPTISWDSRFKRSPQKMPFKS